MLGNATKNFVVETVSTLPPTGFYGQIVVQTSDNTPYIYLGGTWKPFAIPTTGYGSLNIVNTNDHFNAPNAIVFKGISGNLEEVFPDAEFKLLGSINNTPSYNLASSYIGAEQSKGSLWTSTASGGSAPAVEFPIPTNAINAVGGDHVVVGNNNQATGLEWKSLSAAISSVTLSKGALLIGTGTGIEYLAAPTDNQVLVGDTSNSTGWQLRSIDDIVPANTASNSTALIFANANLG
jgi:hypothetical protein